MEQGKGGGGSGAPPPQDAPGAPRAGGHRPGPQLAQQQGWGGVGGCGAAALLPPAGGRAPRSVLPPTARPPVCCRDERKGGLRVRVRVVGVGPGGGEGGSSSPLPLPRRGGAHPHAWRKQRRGGHGLRLKITPRGSTPCGRRSQAHLSPRPPPPALRSLCLATILRKRLTCHVTVGMHWCLSRIYSRAAR